jgi:hypothetical protein
LGDVEQNRSPAQAAGARHLHEVTKLADVDGRFLRAAPQEERGLLQAGHGKSNRAQHHCLRAERIESISP